MTKLTLDYQLGFYVGEYIYDRILPTLSTDELKTRKVINVSEEDTIENKRLHKEWIEKVVYGGNKINVSENIFWKAYFEHNNMLEKKYLPHTLECHVPTLYFDNIDEFKNGLIESLWNSDLCAYSLKPENIKIKMNGNDEFDFFSIIELTLGVILNE